MARHDDKLMCPAGECLRCDALRADPIVARYLDDGSTRDRRKDGVTTVTNYTGANRRGRRREGVTGRGRAVRRGRSY